MFVTDSTSLMSWFRPCSPVELYKFELIGLLFSLAIYNGAIVTANFPRILYYRLLYDNIPETMLSIKDGWPQIASGLAELLKWDEENGSVEDVFVLEYKFAAESIIRPSPVSPKQTPIGSPSEALFTAARLPLMGSNVPELVLDGSPGKPDNELLGPVVNATEPGPQTPDAQDEMVTAANRQAYVRDFTRWLTRDSVEPQYEAFARGFRTLIDPKAASIITPPVLQLLTEGSGDLDVHALRRVARHKGWGNGTPSSSSNTESTEHPLLVAFWDMATRWPAERQRLLLKFVTASDRVPAMGYGGISFVIERNGGDSDLLPSSSTCFGMLMMPEYSSAEKMERKLVLALENCEGFGVP